MADRVERFDWSGTPLGPMARWPASLRTAVGLCLASPVPSLVWWGPGLINIYNDAHAPQLAEKHPAALGMPAATVWAAVWPIVAERVEAVMERGESVFRERERLVMKRSGFPDEMYFTFTFSPIPDDRGGIGGVFHIAIDETARVTAEIESQRPGHAPTSSCNWPKPTQSAA
jgi:hypothetical protein